VIVLAIGLFVLLGVRLLAGLTPGSGTPPSPSTPSPASFLYPVVRVAPALALVDQDGRDFDADDFDGGPTLVFFGYTHCPDVCPATMGIVQQVAADYGTAMRVIFVSVDPERDTQAWLKEYVRYLPAGFRALTGSPARVRAAADAWEVRYAKVETGEPGEYSMSHTADVYLVDGTGRLRAHFPFGTEAGPMLATVRMIAAAEVPASPTAPAQTTVPGTAGPATASPAASAAASPAASATTVPGPTQALSVEVVSSSIWAGGSAPVILALAGPDGRLADPSAAVTVELRTGDPRAELRQTTRAVAVRPPGVAEVSYVAVLDIPSPGPWQLAVRAESRGARFAGTASIVALDPGQTARLGRRAPAVRTPTLDDVLGVALRITTDPLPDRRLSQTSTADALAAGRPFVLVVDSARFRVTPACGSALNLAKFLVDRWPAVPFIHLEPFAYDVITDAPVLRGTLDDPMLVPAAFAWGIDGAPWGARSMPWVFVVDGSGVVRAKYQGVVGSNDLDVIISMVAAGR
jgi:protein SCO1/2